MIKAVIYARYSAGPRQTEQSIEGQVRECRAFAAGKGLDIIEVYADSHISGKTDERPEFQRLIKDAKAKKFQAVVVYKTDRFARNRYDSAIYKRELKRAGVRLYYAAEPIGEGAEGVLMESVLEGMAEYYSLELAQKVKRGMTDNALKAKSNGGTRAFGYSAAPDGSIIINEEEAWYVQEIFRRRIAGETNREIADWLRSCGVKTTRGNNFSTEALNKLIRARKYLGEYKYSDIIKKDAIPAILDEDTWMKAQKQNKTHKKNSPEYRLNGKVFCGLCGAPVHGVSGTSKTGRAFYYYICAQHRKKLCPLRPLKAKALEDAVLTGVRAILFDKEVLDDIVDKIYVMISDTEELDQERSAIEKRLKDIERSTTRIVKAISSGAPQEPLIKELRELDEAKHSLEERYEEIRPKGPKLTKEQIDFALRFFAGKDENMLLDKFVARVEVFEDYLLVYVNLNGPDGDPRIRKIEFDDTRLRSTKPLFVELFTGGSGLIIKVSR